MCTILITLLLPVKWWTLTIGFIVAICGLIVSRPFQIITDKIKKIREDRSVQREFRNWMFGGNTLKNLSSRENPVCPNCGTIYNRAEVICLIKQQSPEIFMFPSWTTKFVCKKCRTHIVISGVKGE